ncbi:ABC transporter permease [Haematobacter missouriensis]|uniref:ABC transporter permease n=1 Tax=Haematobacter missouriensis TaxID=366616 RepID=A0A212ALA4_9RHOB|nr:ABC transporter permease [Haematobacter missouriensis]KFI32467.1 ABC transporter permease [Haematobacter missouriensis]OWJ76461.1 ABC transporter permease [Haematobacter missouriensis]OWJ82267.1 ABC transporter permease [Haematobacter missouriensis]
MAPPSPEPARGGKSAPLAALRREAADLLQGLREAGVWLARRPLHLWLQLAVLALLFAGWSWLGNTLPRGFFATPSETLQALGTLLHDHRQDYLRALGATLKIYFGGLALAAVTGIPLGLALGAAPLLGRTMNPYLNALAATPLIALMPLIILWFGLGDAAKVLIVALGAVIPILINSYTGLRGASPALREMARAFGMSRVARLRHVLLPSAFHPVMAGLRLGAVSGLVTAVIADIYMAMTGLGALLITYGNSFRMGPYLVTVLTLALIGTATTALISLIERLLTPPPSRKRLFH